MRGAATKTRPRFRLWILSLALGCLLALPGVAEDWPRFLGPRGDSRSTETGLLERWPTNGPPLLWEKRVGSGYSAPSVLGSFLVLHHRLGDQEVVEAFDATTGAARWRYAYPSAFADPFGYNNGPRSTPLLTSNRCFTFGAEGRLLCLELHTGKVLWQHDTAKEWNVPAPFFGVGSSPLLEGDSLMVMVGGQPNAAIVAFDARSGQARWASGGRETWDGARTFGWSGEAPYHWTGEEKLASYSTPVAATIHGRRHLLCLTRQGLVSLNPTNGAPWFQRWFQSPVNESINAICPVVGEDLVFISAAYYRIGSLLLRVKPDGHSFEEVWRSPDRAAPGDGDSVPLKMAPVLEAHWSTPILHDGCLYGFSGRNESDASLRCVEFQTGRLLWKREERWRSHSTRQPPVYGRGSLLLADGKLIVLGEGGRLGLFALNPREPEELCVWQVPQLQYPCWTGPVLAHQRLYLRSEDRLLCLGLKR